MRAYIPAYQVRLPKDLSQALEWLQEEPGKWRPISGGTDLMVQLEAGKLAHHRFVNLWGLRELQGIRVEPDAIEVGALTTYSQVRDSEVLKKEFPLLVAAASETGAWAIQNRGTLGGNIGNASPAADSPPALLAYDAEVELSSAKGSRWVAYETFHRGYKKTVLHPEEIVSRIRLPRTQLRWREHYQKVGTRKAQAISKVCFAGRILVDGENEGKQIEDVRLAWGAMAAMPVRTVRTEEVLRGRKLEASTFVDAVGALRAELSPIDDLRSTHDFRLQVAVNLLEEFLARSAQSP